MLLEGKTMLLEAADVLQPRGDCVEGLTQLSVEERGRVTSHVVDSSVYV